MTITIPSTDVDPTLSLDPEQFRRIGYDAIDAIVARAAGLRDGPVARPATRAELEERLREPLPEQPTDLAEVMDTALRHVLGNGIQIDHPRFFGFVPGPGNPVSTLADVLVAGSATFAGAWQASPGATMIELLVLDWLREICDLPAGTEGLLVSGGSMANLTGLAVALQEQAGTERHRATVYLSDQTHTSVLRALRLLGLERHHIRMLPTDDRQRLVVDEVRAAVAADRAAGRLPACVVATAGTTGTGAVDPLAELHWLCEDEALWLHVDGAYGAAAMLSPRGRAELPGLGLADSLSIDPHKWLFQPLEVGCLLVRDGAALQRTFSVTAPILKAATPALGEVNFADRGVQLTRATRALKLWMSLKAYGAAAFRGAVEHGLALAEHAETVLDLDPRFEVVTPAHLGIVTFRAIAPGAGAEAVEAVNAALPSLAMRDGFTYASTTQVDGATVLRLCTINPRTTPEDVERSIAHIADLAGGAFGAAAA